MVFVYNNDFDFKEPTKVDMPLKTKESNQNTSNSVEILFFLLSKN